MLFVADRLRQVHCIRTYTDRYIAYVLILRVMQTESIKNGLKKGLTIRLSIHSLFL